MPKPLWQKRSLFYPHGPIVRGPECDKIELIGCKSHQTHNSGIGWWYCDSVLVKYCEITAANDNDAKYYLPGQRKGGEAPHEVLSICGATNFEVCYNQVYHCYKEGILSKNFRDVFIYRNICDKGWDYEMGFTFTPDEVAKALEEQNFVAAVNLFEGPKNRPSRKGQFDLMVYEYLPPNNQIGAPLYRNELKIDLVPEQIPEVKSTGRKWKYEPLPWFGALKPLN